MMSLSNQNDVATLFWRNSDFIITSYVHWDTPLWTISYCSVHILHWAIWYWSRWGQNGRCPWFRTYPVDLQLSGSCRFTPGLAGFFHLVEETGLNPGLNRPGRNRFLPPEVEETGKKWKKGWNAWLSKYFPLQEAVILKLMKEQQNVLNINTL